jgi:hypothetical protein
MILEVNYFQHNRLNHSATSKDDVQLLVPPASLGHFDIASDGLHCDSMGNPKRWFRLDTTTCRFCFLRFFQELLVEFIFIPLA